MFGCIYQLWDWLESPPLFTSATMDAKKLQQLQQANAQKKIPLAYQTNLTDYRTATQSPVFHQLQQHHQRQQAAAAAAAYQHMQFVGGGYQESPTATSSSGGGPLTPIEMQPHANKLLMKHHIGGGGGGGTSSNSSHSSPYHQSYSSGEQQLYQSPSERTYLAAAGRLQTTGGGGGGGGNPATALQAQYQQLQQAKMQLQMQTQNDAMQQQQRTFAMRQALNPPIPQNHYHMSQSSSIMSSVTMQSQLQQHQQQQQQQQQQQATAAQHQRAPPSTLNLASQFQPATGPLKVNPQLKAAQQQQQQQSHYHQQQLDQQAYAQQQLQLQLQLQHQHQLQPQQQQRLKHDNQTPGGSEQSPVYIQQNHPGHVVNQACQTQISAVKPGGALVVQKGTPSSEESSGASKSPSHAALDRKKSSSSSSQALKSPVTKRPASSPVTLSGWLYKQGSDGLKVWRKRWFVLAEYCLYYYKGPEEEKVLGSILLPSYKVAACSHEDKIYRKFAFKCEHTNMRTYWLAAETAESMIQWVRALTAATMMQAPTSSGGESDQLSQPSGSSSLNHSGENSDSGIHTLQSKMSQGQITPASDNGPGGNGPQTNSGQPLYANAPPKPRRINDGGYSSPSPEHSIDNERKTQTQLMQSQRKQHLQQQQKLQQQQQQQQQQQKQQQHQQHQQSNSSRRSGIMSPTLQQMQQQQHQQQHQQQQQQQRSQQQPQQHHAIYDTRTGNVSSALRLQQSQQQYSVDNLEATKFQQKQMSSQLNTNADDFSKSPSGGDMLGNYIEMEEQIMRLQQQQQQQQQHPLALPDEIYGERELYMQKLLQQRYPGQMGNYPMIADRRTPDAYGRSKNRIYSDYEDIYNMSQLAGNLGLSAQEALLQEAASYRRPISPPSYDASKHVPPAALAAAAGMKARYTPNMLEPTLLQQSGGSSINLRGRSSTNLVRPHSADFLEYEARAEAAAANAMNANSNLLKAEHAMRAPRPKSSLDINRSSDSYYYSEASYAEKMRKSALYLQHPQIGQNANQPASSYRSIADINAATAAAGNPFGSGMHTIAGYENPYERAGYKRADALNAAQSTASMPRMSRAALAAGLTPSASSQHIRSASVHPISPTNASKQSATTTTSPTSFLTPAMSTAQIIQQNEQFLRSASARLPKRSGGSFDEETRTTSPAAGGGSGNSQQDGERKREESMKRLLEWKQRMLQSPLTRKSVAQAGSGSNMTAMAKLGSNPNILLSSTAVASGALYGPQNAAATAVGKVGVGNTVVGGVSGIKRSRSETHANAGPTAGYNSYSSDDEEGSSKKSPAGRLTTNTTTTATTAIKATTNPQNNNIDNNNSSNNNSNNNDANKTIEKSLKANSLKSLQFECVSTSNKSTTKNEKNVAANKPTKILKPILKTKEKSTKLRLHIEPNAVVEAAEEAAVSTSIAEAAGITPEVAILPKKPAPKSPQNIFYTPVYSLKTLPGTSAPSTKNYENVEIEMKTEAVEELETVAGKGVAEAAEAVDEALEQTELTANTEIFDEESMPMLKGLQNFQQAQQHKLKENSMATEEEENKVEADAEKDAENADNVDDDDDDANNCEYTDDDLDEALAVEDADAEDADFDDQIEASDKQIYENDVPQNQPTEENHYLPMTPKRVVVAAVAVADTPAGAAAKSYLSLRAMHDSHGDEDENPYMEMCNKLQQAALDDKSNYEEMCLADSAAAAAQSKQNIQNREMQSEPVYMELASGRTQTSNETTTSQASTSSKTTLKKQSNSSGSSSKKNSDTLKKKSKKGANKRKDLPDILKASQNSLKATTDSSDADDESSKQFDAKKLRSRMRFSLSDTFRPASYYLGAAPALNDSIESSDNEIMAAIAPLTASTPTAALETMQTEEFFSSENYDTVKRRDSNSGGKFNTSYDQLPKMHASNTSLNLAKPETVVLKSSRLSLPDQLSKGKMKPRNSGGAAASANAVVGVALGSQLLKHQHGRTLSDSNYSFQTDNSSNTSSDYDLFKRLQRQTAGSVSATSSLVASPLRYQSSNSLTLRYSANAPPGTGDSSETDSVEFRQHRQNSDSELERQRSRRPLSEESISEIESLNEKFEDANYTPDLDQYLNQLQASDCYVYKSNSSTAYETLNLPQSTTTSTLLSNIIKPPKIFRTKNDANLYGNMHFVSSTDSLQFTGSDSRAEGSQASLYGAAASATPTKYMTPLHSRNNSNISEQSAPYYYSEIESAGAGGGQERFSTPTTLNNQRDVHVHTGANIAHIHNPIERHQFNMETLADKDQAIDSKNIYQMKTNVEKLSYSTTKNLKAGETFHPHQHRQQECQQPLLQLPLVSHQPSGFLLQQMQNPALKLSNFDRNLQPASPTNQPSSNSSKRVGTVASTKNNNLTLAVGNNFRVLESSCGVGGNVTAKLTHGSGNKTNANTMAMMLGATPKSQDINQIKATTNVAHQANENQFSVLGASAKDEHKSAVVAGELLWEEDTLWRESLRRVSQRHARSLDDLDRIVPTPKIIIVQPEKKKQTKPKITRDVTYVNDDVLRFHTKNSRHNLSTPTPTAANVADDAINENDVYVQLLSAQNETDPDAASDVYEVLLHEEETGSNISHKSAELDRETIRQWDSMSSGLMKNVTNSSSSNSNANNQNLNTEASQNTTASAIENSNSNVKSIVKQWNTSLDESNANSTKSTKSNLQLNQ